MIADESRWPEHLAALCRRLHPTTGAGLPAPSPPAAAERGAAWVALRNALTRFLRGQARQFGGVSTEDLEDLASAKALELLLRAESGEWSLEGRSGGELAGYLSTVARNALIDLTRRRTKLVSQSDLGDTVDLDDGNLGSPLPGGEAQAPDAPALAREFIDSLRECFVQLQPRARRVWFFRVFYGMSSRAIALHPTVLLRASHVDVVMQRTRTSIRSCMESKGFEPADLPNGTFVELWGFLESLRDDPPAGVDAEVERP